MERSKIKGIKIGKEIKPCIPKWHTVYMKILRTLWNSNSLELISELVNCIIQVKLINSIYQQQKV